MHGELVTLQMSEPQDLQLNVELEVEGEDTKVHFINSGVPHVVVPVARVDVVNVHQRGRSLRRHERFLPAGANVNFIEKAGPKKILVRTYERGVEEETLACGTGVVASALIFASTEKIDGPISVTVRSESALSVDFKRVGDKFTNVTLTGPAEFAFEGTIDV
ncbi:MAG: diaminopimelate epimerase [Verrucomicrobia bacterium]|nr:diaminopimelate epimerase [Verrucomicrobiota bacterium]